MVASLFGKLLGRKDAAHVEPEPLGHAAEEVSAMIVAEEAVPEPEPEPAKDSWFARLKGGLAKSSTKLTQGLTALFTKRKLDDAALEELEELLITADLGLATAQRVTRRLAKSRFGEDVEAAEIKAALAEEIAAILAPVALPLEVASGRKPHVVLVVGVNGSGKTTTIGKLAKQCRDRGLSVSLAAAHDRGDDVLFIDTAGRLHNKSDLMAELQKIVRVIKKQDETAPHDVLLVLDAGVGQNAHTQVEVFKDMIDVSGLVLTKLDGTARGGVLVALAEKFGLPVHAIGIGEKADDLRPFAAEAFARSLVGLD